MKRLLCFFGSFISVCLSGCTSTLSTPSSPSNSSSWVLTGPLVQADFADLEGNTSLDVYLADPSGPVTNAAVTYQGAGVSATNLPYVTNVPGSVGYQGSTHTINVGVYQLFNITYTPASPYTVIASFDGQTYSDSITAIGFNSYQAGASGVTCSWIGGVSSSSSTAYNYSQAFGRDSSGVTVFTDPSSSSFPILNSPLTLSGPPYSAAASILVECGAIKNAAFPGTFPASYINALEEIYSNY